MDPVKFRGHQKVLGAPPNWDKSQGECVGLPVQIMGSSVVSVWSFTDEERKLIAEGADLVVHVITGGPTQPPIGFTVQSVDRCDFPILMMLPFTTVDGRDEIVDRLTLEGLASGEDFHVDDGAVLFSTEKAARIVLWIWGIH